MNLLQVRINFRKLSGRFDLVNADFSDNGADFYINAGCRYLDRASEVQKTWASRFVFAGIGSWFVEFPYCRAVKEVWVSTTTARWQLEKMNLQDLLATYFTELVSLADTGSPVYYSPAVTRHIPEDEAIGTEVPGYTDVLESSGHEYNAIAFAPFPDEKMLMEVVGLFYSMELVDDTDENLWSAIHSSILLKSSFRELEVFNGNPSGVKTWEAAISADLNALSGDLVEELIAEVDQMEG